MPAVGSLGVLGHHLLAAARILATGHLPSCAPAAALPMMMKMAAALGRRARTLCSANRQQPRRHLACLLLQGGDDGVLFGNQGLLQRQLCACRLQVLGLHKHKT